MLREALGEDAQIRLDSNMQWSLTTARWVLREIEPYNIRNYEDPVAYVRGNGGASAAFAHSVLDARA